MHDKNLSEVGTKWEQYMHGQTDCNLDFVPQTEPKKSEPEEEKTNGMFEEYQYTAAVPEP